ncbi:MAG: aldehyde dehydrogenase family protein [Bacteroidota bacterium]|nr:aldehyde dehydrogenase family protein [Bacteroidota bacterium]
MKHKGRIERAIKALQERTFYAPYPENPKAYDAEADAQGKEAFQKAMSNPFVGLNDDGNTGFIGEEVSPYMMVGLGAQYPQFSIDTIMSRAIEARAEWSKMDVDKRADLLIDMLDAVSKRFFELGYATMHTTGQSFVMSFQASGPHANDRAMESVALGYQELTRYSNEVDWVKPMGKFDLKIKKNFKPISKGVGLVIGCSTFPTWNTVPGVFANLIYGNSTVIKPHPKSIMPIAIVVAEMQKVLVENGLSPYTVQLAVDTVSQPITKDLAEHEDIKLIDYTGGTAFGDYIESIQGKTVFSEKAGVNSVILESVKDPKAVFGNLAFSFSLYSGQMCTAPQNIFVPADGIKTADGHLSYDEVVEGLSMAVKGLAENPKMGAFVLGAIQNDNTKSRVNETLQELNASSLNAKVSHPEFADARLLTPTVLGLDENDEQWKEECFGPIVFVVKSNDPLKLAAEMAEQKGAITCLCYSTDESYKNEVENTMNAVFTPVSFNFVGAAFVNQHAAFSDFHVSGGNPSGNASFTDALYINRRFVWVGNRYA